MTTRRAATPFPTLQQRHSGEVGKSPRGAPGAPQQPPRRAVKSEVRGPLPTGSPPAGEHHPGYLTWPSVPPRRCPPLSPQGLSPRSLTKLGRDPAVCFGLHRKAAEKKEGRRGGKPPGSWVHLLGAAPTPVLCLLPKHGVPGAAPPPPGTDSACSPSAAPRLISPSRDFREIG